MAQISPLSPLFGYQAIFGDVPAFSSTPLLLGTATAIDAFLGFTSGTTKYGASAGGQNWGCTGRFTGTSVATVQALEQVLLSQAGWVRPWIRPDGGVFSDKLRLIRNAMFLAPEIVFGVPSPLVGAGMYTASYRMIIRQLGGAG